MLLQNAWICPLDDEGTELPDGWVLVRDGLVEAVGGGGAPDADSSVDLHGAVVTPGPGQHPPPPVPDAHPRPGAAGDAFRAAARALSGLGPDRRGGRVRGCSGRASPSSRCRGARPCSTTTTSSRVASNGSGRPRCRRRRSSESGSSHRAGRWISESLPGGLPPDSLVESIDDVLAETERLAGLQDDEADGPVPQSRHARRSPPPGS